MNLDIRKTQFSSFEQLNSRAIDVGVNDGSLLFIMLGLSFTSKLD